ncbi:MAG: hypothetical protein VB131_07530 [Burkholderia gladioli]
MSALRIADRQHNRSEATASAGGTESAAELTMFVGIVPESGAIRFDVSATGGFAMARRQKRSGPHLPLPG